MSDATCAAEACEARAAAPFIYSAPSHEANEVPVVVDSPHSGRIFPLDWPIVCDPVLIRRRCEDAFVDTLCKGAPALGAHFLAATISRAYVDLNRPLTSLRREDVAGPTSRLASGQAPDANARCQRGYYWRACREGNRYHAILAPEDIPTERELLDRHETYWLPYHHQLHQIRCGLLARHGICLHFNMHGFLPSRRAGGADIILGNRFGASASSEWLAFAASHFEGHGFAVALNDPYPGGEIITLMGAPRLNCHSIQVEIRKALYMDPHRLTLHGGRVAVSTAIETLVTSVARRVEAERPGLPCFR